MQFKVPQFIDIEDKLFGPFTFRQFVYLIGGAGGVFIIYKLLPLWIGIFFMIPIAGLAALLAFYKINKKPFIHYLQAGFGYFTSSRLYVWKQRIPKPTDEDKDGEGDSSKMTSVVPVLSSSKLKDLSWSLDVEEKEPRD